MKDCHDMIDLVKVLPDRSLKIGQIELVKG